ncbi:MAG: hypothetical protein AUI63_06170 [Gemmatimonadetes bacterium 13_1_40CM_2_60_3]|nr:MAG: hypothetical protein AUI63_06170 [Gemmatimonadetes bacterium 13_1_40CM_2_60_3]
MSRVPDFRMRHFFRTQLTPVTALRIADEFFPEIGIERSGHTARSRTFSGDLGTLQLSVRKEGGHRNAKKFFVALHKAEDPRHRIEAAY